MNPNGMANSVDPDQTAPLVWSGSALFAKACLSENLGSLRYCYTPIVIKVTSKICFYFISCQKSIPEDAEL